MTTLVGGLAVRDALAAADDLRAAQSDLAPGSDGASEQELDRGLAQAAARLNRAADRLDRPAPRLAAAVPVLGRSWRAERRAVAAGQAVVAGARAVTAALPGLRREGGLDTAGLEALADDLDQLAPRASQAWQALRDTPLWGTPPMVSEGVEQALDALRPGVTGLERGATGARVAAGLLGADEPRSLLVALQNNAELRGGGGYVSTFATGRAVDGRLELDPFRDVASVSAPVKDAEQVPAPEEYREDFGVFLADTTHWRNWTMSPHVPADAAVGAAVAGRLLGTAPTAVLLLDVPAVAALVGLSGEPARLPGGQQVPADQLIEALLVDSYAEAGVDEADQQVRRQALQASAGSSLARLLGADLDLTVAVTELGRLARGRHLVLWSADPAEQEALEQLGVAGEVTADGGDLLHPSVNNLTANKLDYYVDRQVEHDVELGPDSAAVTTRVRLVNSAPADLVPYVAGVTTPGRSSLRVELSFDPDATFRSLEVDGRSAEGDVRFGPDRARAFTYVDLGIGETVDVVLRHTVPVEDGRYAVRALPQALARDADLTVTVRGADDRPIDEAAGLQLVDGVATRRGAWSEGEQLSAALEAPGRWERLRASVRRFWDEPVELG